MTKKLKKPVSILLSLIMVFSMFAIVPFTASAYNYTEDDGSVYADELYPGDTISVDTNFKFSNQQNTAFYTVTLQAGSFGIGQDLDEELEILEEDIVLDGADIDYSDEDLNMSYYSDELDYWVYLYPVDENGEYSAILYVVDVDYDAMTITLSGHVGSRAYNLNDDNADMVWDDRSGTGGFWFISAVSDDEYIQITNNHKSQQVAGTYEWDDVDDVSCKIEIFDPWDEIFFTDGSCTVTIDGNVVTVSGTFIGEDEWTYEITLSTVTDQYNTAPTYTVTWKNWNGDVLETDENVEAGALPKYDGAVPTKPEDTTTTYTFAAWDDGTTTYLIGQELPPVTGDVTYTAVFTAERKPLFAGHSITLSGDIGVYFYLRLREEEVPDTTVTFTWDDEKLENVPVELDPNGTGYYRAKCPVAVAEMTCPITATVTTAGNVKDETDVYSVKQYADYILSEEYKSTYTGTGAKSYENLERLVKTMLDYGAKAQTKFGINTDELANADV